MGFKVGSTEIIDSSGNITATVGDIDGRDIAADGLKLDGIATGADVTSSNLSAALTGLVTNAAPASGDIIPTYDIATSTWKKATITAAALQGPAGADGANGANGANGATGPAGTPSTSFNTVGSYCFAKSSAKSTRYLANSTYAGSGLRAGGVSVSSSSCYWVNGADDNGGRSGTWRCMGENDHSSSSWYSMTLFVRIS